MLLAMGTIALNDRLTETVTATAGQTDFSADFPLVRDATGAPRGVCVRRVREAGEEILTFPDLSVVSESDAGFVARLALPCLEGDQVQVFGQLPTDRNRTHPAGGATRTVTLEGDAVDTQVQLQEARRDIDRGIRAPLGEQGSTLPPVAERANKWAAWDAFGRMIAAAGALIGLPVTAFMAGVLTIADKAGLMNFLGIAPAIDHYGGDGAGLVDASAAIAAAGAGGQVLTLAGRTYRISQNMTIAAPLAVEMGASFTIDAGKTLTITGDLDVRGQHQVFKGAGSVVLAGANRDVEALWFGGAIADVAPGVLKAFNAGARNIHLPRGPCGWITHIVLDTSTGARWVDLWLHNDVAFGSAGGAALKWRRAATPNTGLVLRIRGSTGQVYETGLGQHSFAIDFRGTAVTAGMSITRAGSVVTVTLPGHGLLVGQTAYIETIDQPEYSGAWPVTAVVGNTFQYNIGAATPATPATGAMCLAGKETGHYNDNKLIIEDVEFRGFFRSVYTTRCGGLMKNIVARFNAIFWESGRDSSFFTIQDYLGVANKTGIYYIDPIGDSLSNGVTLTRCYEVFSSGAGSLGAMVFQGIQGLLGNGNSVDLCSGGTYCVALTRVTDPTIEFIWMASDLAVSASHRGLLMMECFRGIPKLPELYNQLIGVVADKGTLSADSSIGIALGVTENVQQCNVLLFGVDGFMILDGYDIRTACPRSGANFEFYQASGGKTIVGKGKMRGGAYVPSLGAGSDVATPMFL